MDKEKIKEIADAAKKSLAENQKTKRKVPAYVKCDCGHTAKDHYQGMGYCHDSKHPKAGQCSCTWYHPNVKWCMRQQLKDIMNSRPASGRNKKLAKAIKEYEMLGIKIPKSWILAKRKLEVKPLLFLAGGMVILLTLSKVLRESLSPDCFDPLREDSCE
jgi:ribosomal protein L39E